jgi:hypothetical protein
LTGAVNLAPTGIQSPDPPARSETLYRLTYPGNRDSFVFNFIYLFISNRFSTKYFERIYYFPVGATQSVSAVLNETPFLPSSFNHLHLTVTNIFI